MTSYPPLSSDRLLPLRLIAQRLQDDPNYRDKPACPYTGEVKVWLKSVFARRDEAQAGLLERLISVGEKAIGLKQNAEFQRIMLGVVDDLLNDEQRVEMMKRLGEAA